MISTLPIDDALTSAGRLWSIHMRFRDSLPAEDAATLARRVPADEDFAGEMFEHLQSLSDAVSSCAHDSDEAFEQRAKPFFSLARAGDPGLAAMTRFVLGVEADSMLGGLGGSNPDGANARKRLAMLREFASVVWRSAVH